MQKIHKYLAAFGRERGAVEADAGESHTHPEYPGNIMKKDRRGNRKDQHIHVKETDTNN